MSRRGMILGLTLAFIFVPVAASMAATANFKGNCTSSFPNNCVFDTRLPSSNPTSCGSASVTNHFWDYGDATYGSQFQWTTSVLGSHTYPPGMNTIDICMTVFCSDGSSASKCHCFGNVIGYSWCIRPNGSWTP